VCAKEINLQHSRVATDNLMQIIAQENPDMVMIQEPYLYQNSPKGITRGYRTYTHGKGKSRAAIIITSNTIDALLLTQYSDRNTVLLEIQKGNKKFYAASIYLDFNEEIDNSLKKLENILQFTKGEKLIMASESNSR
jgi:exonuclease III